MNVAEIVLNWGQRVGTSISAACDDGRISGESSEDISRILAATLKDLGEPYYLSDSVRAFLLSSLPDADQVTFHRESFPSDYGYITFQSPWITDGDAIQSISWSCLDLGVLFASYSVDPSGTLIHSVAAKSLEFRYGERALAKADGVRVDACRLLSALFVFIRQKILMSLETHLPRSALRRKQRKPGFGPSWTFIREIDLRSFEYIGEGLSEERDVAWSCRWVVSGHWREQWYPARNRHELIWIGPYVKGPKDKPIRHAQRFFKVVR